MRVDQVAVDGENFVGLLGFATDAYAILSAGFPQTDVLDVPTIRSKVYGTNLVGMFCTGNSNGIIMPYFTSDTELAHIRNLTKDCGAVVEMFEDKHTALGNMICANDKGAIVSSSITNYKKIEEILKVPVVSMEIGGHIEVGAYITATNKGFIAHPDAEKQIDAIKDALGVAGMIGTVNCGIPFVKSGLISNSNGYLTGTRTTGIELQRIDDALGFVY